MRGRSSPKLGTKGEMEIGKVDKPKEEPHLSGAYIRSLVKQLTSSRTKDPMNPKDIDGADAKAFTDPPNLIKLGEACSDHNQQSQQQRPQQPHQQHKKQVRRRLHTSRPYQERLLNMAEARREIVTALKFHRAAMKQASEQQQKKHQQSQTQPEVLHPSPPPSLEQEGKFKSSGSTRINASNNTTGNFSNYLDNLSYSSSFSCPPFNSCSWPASMVPRPLPDNFNLPNQSLGLNLNLHDFNNLDTTLYQNSNNYPSSVYFSSSLSPSSSCSPTLSAATEEVPSMMEAPPLLADYGGGLGLHAAMDDEDMAEIRSIGEKHQMEWNDTMNLVTSAWWFKFLKTMEIGPEEKSAEDDFGYCTFDELMEFPSWLNTNEDSTCLQQHLNDDCWDDYVQDPALPCMDIDEFEGMDGEWLA